MQSALARWISIVAHPFVMVAIMVAASALHSGTAEDALRSVALVGAVTLVPVAVLMIRQVRRGAWENVDASNRAERPILFAVSTGLTLFPSCELAHESHPRLLPSPK